MKYLKNLRRAPKTIMISANVPAEAYLFHRSGDCDLPEPARVTAADDAVPTAVTNSVASTGPALVTSDMELAVEIPGDGNGGERGSPSVPGIREAVARHLRYPLAARRRGVEGQVTISLTIDARGELLRAQSLSPGADSTLTTAALAAAQRAAPFSVPRMFPGGQTMTAQLPIQFRLVE